MIWLKPHPESLVIECFLEPSPQYTKIPPPESRDEHSDFTKIWVVLDTMMTVLEGFHHRIKIWMTGMTKWRGDGREWEWDLVDTTLEVTGIWPIREYV